MNTPGGVRVATRGIGPGAAGVRGYILLPVAIGIALIATVAMTLNIESTNDANQVGAELQATQAQYIAEAGLTHTLWKVRNNSCSGDYTFQNTLAGVGQYSGQIEAEASTVNHYSLPVVSDTYIEERDPNQIRGSQSEIHIRNDYDKERRGLFRFDLSAIPETETIVEARARFYVTRYESDKALAVKAVTKTWTEADANWASMAVHMGAVHYASIAPQAQGTWVSVNLTALARYWLNVPDANHGLLVVSPDNGGESRFSSREGGASLAPRLDVITADGTVSPVQVSTTATLEGSPGAANDISRTLTRADITVHQQPVQYFLQPDRDTGKDTHITDWKPSWNFGAREEIEVKSGVGNTSHGLLYFNINVPAGARIDHALLSLYQTSPRSEGAVINVLRILSEWEEGTGNGANATGSSWQKRDNSRYWNRPGGDLDQRLFSSMAMTSGINDWASWDISDLVQGWVDGAYPNRGLALVPASATTDLRFASSDASSAAQRPKLFVTYRCECDSPCLAPEGSGRILMVVGDDSNPSSGDIVKKARFESWGFAVTTISDNASLMGINSAAALSDVIYVADSVSAAVLGNKLTNLATGIVSEAGAMNSKLGMASSHGYAAGSTIKLSDNSHFISAVFPTGPLPLYKGAMEQQVIAGGSAAGLQQLADTASQAALTILEAGAPLGGEHSGQNAAGRRVLLPLGRETRINWDLLHGNGLLLVQRAIVWAQQTD